MLAESESSICCDAPRPSKRSANENPAGSSTPFSFEHDSQRSIFFVLPSTICVRCTLASLLHPSISQSICLESFYVSVKKIKVFRTYYLKKLQSFRHKQLDNFIINATPRKVVSLYQKQLFKKVLINSTFPKSCF